MYERRWDIEATCIQPPSTDGSGAASSSPVLQPPSAAAARTAALTLRQGMTELPTRGLPLLHRPRIRHRHRGEKRLRVVVLRVRVDLLGRPDLYELAAVHHGDAVAHRADDGEVMRDKEVGEAEVALEVLEQVEDL